MKTLTLRVEDSIYQMIKAAADGQKRNISNFIEFATLQYLTSVQYVDNNEMNEIFFRDYQIYNLFTGFDLNNHWYFFSWEGNVHNAYLNFLASAGLGAIIFYTVIVWSVVKLFLKKEFTLFVLVIPLLFRAFFDISLLLFFFQFTLLFSLVVFAFDKKKSDLVHEY